jgi:hypothetical protein
VFADENHLAAELCSSFYQRLIAAYAHPDRRRGKTMTTAIIDALRSGVPAALEELAQLGRTLWRRRADVLAYFDHHASNGPTEAINGRLEALCRNALGFRHLTHYRLRSLLHCGTLAQLIYALCFRKNQKSGSNQRAERPYRGGGPPHTFTGICVSANRPAEQTGRSCVLVLTHRR